MVSPTTVAVRPAATRAYGSRRSGRARVEPTHAAIAAAASAPTNDQMKTKSVTRHHWNRQHRAVKTTAAAMNLVRRASDPGAVATRAFIGPSPGRADAPHCEVSGPRFAAL